MPFSWKAHPEVLEVALQYIEDHTDFKGSAAEGEAVVARAKTVVGIQECATLTWSSINSKLSAVIREHKLNRDHSLKFLWTHGARILNLQALGYKITLNSERDVVNDGSSRKRGSAEVEDTEQSCSKRPKKFRTVQSKKRALEDTDDSGSDHSESSVDGPQSKRQKRATANRSQKRALPDAEPAGQTATKRLRHGTTQAVDDMAIDSDEQKTADTDSNNTEMQDTSETPAETCVQKDIVDHQDYVIQTIESDQSSLSDIATEEGEDEGNGEKEKDEAVSSAKTTPATAQKSLKVTLKLPQNKAFQQQERPSTKLQQQFFTSQSEPSWMPFNEALCREQLPSIDEDYVPSQPSELAHSPSEIRDAMRTLAELIYQTVFTELEARGIDPHKPYRLNADLYDDSGLEVFNKIFGTQWNINYLKIRLVESLTQRRLMLQTFIEAFIGASVTLHALEPSPLGELNKDSTEYKLFEQSLRYIRDKETLETGGKHLGEYERETVRSYAIRNHIQQSFMPSIEEKATILAHELRGQLLALFMAEKSPWYCVPRHLNPYGNACLTSFNAPTADDYPAIRAPMRLPQRDILFHNLKKIFTYALAERAKWESVGEAQYQFRFESFGADFMDSIHQPCEDSYDRNKPHEIFLSILPSVWARHRGNRTSPWRALRCVAKAVVLLVDK